MDSNNIILNMPFDEREGAHIAYDYSASRADGDVIGAHFVVGNSGNAIKFAGDDGRCEVSQNIINLANPFSILAWVRVGEVVCGTPKKLIWLLNFAGMNNYVELSADITPNTWISTVLTRKGSQFNVYINGSLVATTTNSGTLSGISLNQDFYGSDYGLGSLDDVKFYNIALSRQEILDALTTARHQNFFLDGVDFKDYGVYVSNSKGIVSRPKLKAMASVSYDNYHGEAVDLRHKFFESREITLSCFIKALSKYDFLAKIVEFEQLFDKQGANRLLIDVHPVKPLIYEVYCKDEIAVSKKWSDDLMVGTFDLKLTEPEPVKRILKHIRVGESSKTCTITLTTTKLVNIYWGDGCVDEDLSGDDYTITHDYTINGDYFPVITGCIDEITDFTTNAIVVWNKL